MLTFAYYLLKVMICSGIMYSYYLLALRNKRFHQYNRWYLLSAVALSFVIPLIKIELWKETQPQGVVQVITFVNKADAYVAVNTSFWNWDNIAFAVFGSISFIFLLSVCASLIKIFLLIKRNPKEVWDNICFVFSKANGTPFSFFKYIFWNTEIDIESDTGKHILKHELAHVHEKHSADKLFLSLVLIPSWANPFVWLIRKELNVIHEFIADQKAIEKGDEHAFAMMLLKASYPQQNFMLANSFFHSSIKRRLTMITSSKNTRFTYLRRVAILPLLTLTFILFSFTINKVKNPAAYPKTNNSISLANQSTNVLLQDTDHVIIAFGDTTKKRATDKTKRIVDSTGSIYLQSDEIRVDVTDKDSADLRKPLFVLDGKVITQEAFKSDVKIDQIESITVLKGESATLKYGEKGKNGVIEIITKQNSGQKVNNGNTRTYDKVFTQVENPPSYAGNTSFADYIRSNLRYPAEAISNKTEGKVLIKFIVDEDGNLTNFTPLTTLGNGLEEEAIRLVKNSGPWKPAIQNGRKVVFEARQEINFAISENVFAAQNYQPAQFPGGLESWKRYLLRNANLNVLAENKAPVGTYTVGLSFNVSTDGSISKIVTETNPGYGTAEEAIKLISKGPKWQPAKKDGSVVASQVKQTISFTVTKDGSYVTVGSIAVGRG